MVGAGMVCQSWHQFLRSLPRSPVFFYQLWNLNHSSFGVRPVPLSAPAQRSRLSPRKLGVCVSVGNGGLSSRVAHQTFLAAGRPTIAGQVHTAGSHIRSSVFVWTEQYPTHRLTHNKNTHIGVDVELHTSAQLSSEWLGAVRYLPHVSFMSANAKRYTQMHTHTLLDVNTGIHTQKRRKKKHNRDSQSQHNSVFFSYQHHMMFVLFSEFWREKTWRGEQKERERGGRRSDCAGDGNCTVSFLLAAALVVF